MTIKEKDFIEIEFSGRVKGGDTFDSTKKQDAKTLGIKEESLKPLILSVGNEMVVDGLDKDFIGKEVGKDYSIEIQPENAFGKRDPTLIQMVPLANFKEQDVFPQKGMQFSFDGRLAKVVSVSGGRILVDFNNALAGRVIIYDYKILRKVEDKKEQIDALQEFFFRRKFDSKIEGNIAKIKIEKKVAPLFELMKKKFEDIISLKVELEILSEKV